MEEQLKAARENIEKGDVASVAEAVEQIKQLPRSEEGVFDLSAVDGDFFEAARWVYPVYAAYETECNQKEGYPDLLNQMRAIDKRYGSEEPSLCRAARFLDLLISTIENISPQLYEYYRELADIFKARLGEVIRNDYRDGHYTAEGEDGAEAEELIRSAVSRASRKYILLGEKYQEYC